MNYRHAYHAGNFADVLKHVVLVLALDYLKKKPKPFQIVDTHAGCGLYDLDAVEAQKTGEWRSGIGRLIGHDAPPLNLDSALDEILAPYLDLISQCNNGGALTRYPGSPWFAAQMVRPQDRVIANELHPADYATLAAKFIGAKNVQVRNIDGWELLKAVLPPPQRRGLILIDPPFEEPGDLHRLTTGLAQAVKRFATGTYILWYPIKEREPIEQMIEAMRALALPKLLRIELMIRNPSTDQGEPHGLSGCGLLVLNPPYTLHEQLSQILPDFALRFAGPRQMGSFKLERLAA